MNRKGLQIIPMDTGGLNLAGRQAATKCVILSLPMLRGACSTCQTHEDNSIRMGSFESKAFLT